MVEIEATSPDEHHRHTRDKQESEQQASQSAGKSARMLHFNARRVHQCRGGGGRVFGGVGVGVSGWGYQGRVISF